VFREFGLICVAFKCSQNVNVDKVVDDVFEILEGGTAKYVGTGSVIKRQEGAKDRTYRSMKDVWASRLADRLKNGCLTELEVEAIWQAINKSLDVLGLELRKQDAEIPKE
jgi:hypothetical protein